MSSKLKGAVAPDELLDTTSENNSTFIECDPKDGFSVRNFQIQACKLAMVSDIIVYGDHKTNPNDTIALAKRISEAQRQYEDRNGFPPGLFNTFMLSGEKTLVFAQKGYANRSRFVRMCAGEVSKTGCD